MRLNFVGNRLAAFWLIALVALVGPWYGCRPPERPPEAPPASSAPQARAPAPATDVDTSALPKTPRSFNKAKKVLYDNIYRDHSITFYCGCRYDGKKVDLSSCGVTPRKNAERAARLEAEHVFPAHQFGNFRQCWREPICTKSDGTKYKGRKCCEEIDPVFQAAHNDLMNLYPSEGEVNGDRSNFNWGMVPGEKREYGSCNMEVDESIRRAEPPENIMGDIARTMFYMEATYGFRLSDQDRQLFTAWNKTDPPDDWERTRNQRIKGIQGRGNPFIENWR